MKTSNYIAQTLVDLLYSGFERFGIYYSAYRGIVVDNKDPKYLNRVKLQVPQVFGETTLEYWAWPKGLHAHRTGGIQLIPKSGEVVWVSFELGNPRRPIWNFGYRGEKDYIAEELRDYNLTWFKTKEGNLIEVDDTNKLIRITSAGGRVLEIADNISIGTKGVSSNSAVLGEELTDLLERLLDTLQNAKVITALGPQPFLPNTITELLNIEADLETILSTKTNLD
jgi:hypothetical protein